MPRATTAYISPRVPVVMRIGVIGAGAMGANHARVVHTHHELVGIVDADPKTREAVAARHGVPAYGDLEALLDAQEAEAVVVATPTVTHEPIATRALQAGLHVLVEKPIAPDLAAARRLIEAADEAGSVLAVGHIERHNPVVAFAKEALEARRFGRPITLSTRRVSRFPGRIRDVGCLLDIGIHDLDVLMHLMGGVPVDVYALGGTHAADEGYEDHASILLRFADGVQGAVEVNWLTPRKVRKLSLTCDEAFVECDYIEQSVEVSKSRFGDATEGPEWPFPVETSVERVQLIKEEPLVREWADFVRACEGDGRPLADGQVGFDALAVAHAALRSMQSGAPERPHSTETVASTVKEGTT